MERIGNNKTIECPNCHQLADVKSNISTMLYVLLILIVTLGVCMWIPIIGWVCIPILLILIAILAILTIIVGISGGATARCPNCKTQYKMNRAEYKDFLSDGKPSFTSEVKESWNNSQEANKHIFTDKIEKLEKKLEYTTDERKAERIRKEIKRLQKHI